jgi:hypothetical protein
VFRQRADSGNDGQGRKTAETADSAAINVDVQQAGTGVNPGIGGNAAGRNDRPRRNNPALRQREQVTIQAPARAAVRDGRQDRRYNAWSGGSNPAYRNDDRRRRDADRRRWQSSVTPRYVGHRHTRDCGHVRFIYSSPWYYSSWGSWYIPLTFGGIQYYYYDGDYYRRSGFGFSLVDNHIGIYLYRLPLGYRTMLIGDIPYYYVNHRYYVRDRFRNAYLQVDDPFESVSYEADEDGAGEHRQLYVYANQGQSQEQTAQDKYECHLWAVEQSGFDPSLGKPGAHDEYQRAQSACLEGRGYTVR